MYGTYIGLSHPPSNSGKWGFSSGSPTKNMTKSWWWPASWAGGQPKTFTYTTWDASFASGKWSLRSLNSPKTCNVILVVTVVGEASLYVTYIGFTIQVVCFLAEVHHAYHFVCVHPPNHYTKNLDPWSQSLNDIFFPTASKWSPQKTRTFRHQFQKNINPMKCCLQLVIWPGYRETGSQGHFRWSSEQELVGQSP